MVTFIGIITFRSYIHYSDNFNFYVVHRIVNTPILFSIILVVSTNENKLDEKKGSKYYN
ncbi:MAG: hypothetical protein MJZ34_06490 [Paludibacteraceae bacterium]|nr:hypothetical protein [Paludibacteraceae bacterium]